jgi:peptide deformylase
MFVDIISRNHDEVKYITDTKLLQRKCKACKNGTAGTVAGNRLLEILKENKDGIGLAANQVGIDLAVCVINVIKPIILVNPKIVGRFGRSFYQEACLSFPGDYIITERWTDIVVKDDHNKKELVFSFQKNALECVCVQHEIDHLNGITIMNRAVPPEIFDVKN